MTKLIAFDTSAAHCAAALLIDNHVVTRVDEMAKGQAEHLMGMLIQMLANEDLTWEDLDGVGVGIGPGNFTGIRISVAAARGLALGLDVPAVGVSTFDAMQHGLADKTTIGLPAPRGQFYVKEYGASSSNAPYILGADQDPPTFAPLKPAEVMIADLARVAASRLGLNPPAPAPLYMRPADAAPAKDAAPTILP